MKAVHDEAVTSTGVYKSCHGHSDSITTPAPNTHSPALTPPTQLNTHAMLGLTLLSTLFLATSVLSAPTPVTGLSTRRVVGFTAPASATAGANITTTLQTEIYIQNYDSFGLIWGLRSAQETGCTGCVGEFSVFTDL